MGFNLKTWLTLLVGILMSIMIITLAKASTLSDFKNSFYKFGVDRAVEDSLKNGASPSIIISCGLKITGLDTQNLIKALYCAGVDGADIRNAALSQKIPEEDIIFGFKKSTDERTKSLFYHQGFPKQPPSASCSTP